MAETGKENETIRIGLGETVITPRENLLMRGFARSQVATGVHDDLHARTLVVEGVNGKTVAVMTLSLVYLERELVERIRKEVNAATGIQEDHILVSCTHTHAGPYVEKAPESYQEFLVERSAASAAEAWENRRPGRIGIDSTELLELGRNRRRLLYGGLHPDPQLAIVKVEDTEGSLRGVMFNYGCHPSTLDWRNTLYSEDWPYYAVKGLKRELGGEVWAAYLQSAQGDINTGYSSELSAVGVDMPVRNYWYIEVKGNQMAEAVLEALPSVETADRLDVDSVTGFFDFPLRESFPVTLEQAERDAGEVDRELEEAENDPELAGTRRLDLIRFKHFSAHQRLEFAKKYYGEEHPESISMEMQAVRIGDAVFVSLPGEVFSEIALEIKKRSPFAKTYAAGVANGYYGYMPTAEEFIEGDYEVDGCKYSPRAAGVCVESGLELINRLKERM